MKNGWIKLHRKFLKWEWYQKSEMVHLFLHFLLLANHKSDKWQGQEIKTGQFITGRKSLKENTGLSEQTIRSCIKRLKSTNEITSKITNKYSLITITKWKEYQGSVKKSTSKTTSTLTNNQPATNQQLTTNNNIKNDKNDKNNNIAAIAAETDIYKITDLWSINNVFYDGAKENRHQRDDGAKTTTMTGQNLTDDGAKTTYKEEPIEEEPIKNTICDLKEAIKFWNTLEIENPNLSIKTFGSLQHCRKETDDIKKEWLKLKLPKEDWELAVQNYLAEINERDPKNDYAKHRFSFYEFVKQSNGFKKFFNKGGI